MPTTPTIVPVRHDLPVPSTASDTLIGDIYQCVLDPRGWPAVIGRVVAAIGGVAGWVAVHYPDRIVSTYQIEVGTDPEWQRRLRETFVPLSPFIGAAHYVRTGDILAVGDVADYDEFAQGRFYREWAAPQGWPDLIFAVLAREPDRFGFMGICLPGRAEPGHKRAAALFTPHLDRALRILDLLDAGNRRLADLAATVGVLATGVVLVDARTGVRGVNPAAERLLGGRAPPPGWRLHVASAPPGRLDAAIARCAAGAMPFAGETMLVEADRGRRLSVHVVPLPRTDAAWPDRAVAALFIADPDAIQSMPSHSVVERYGLTPTELRVALALIDGHAPKAIAAMHGVAMPTLRTHLRRLYDKTGTSGQATLVALLGSALRAI